MATAICSHCGKVTSAEAALCVHCGLKLRRPKRRDLETPVVCPECGKTAELVWLASIQVDVCPGCRGVWFEKEELAELPQRITDRELANAAAEMLGRFGKHDPFVRRPSYLKCPICAGHMTRRNYREVSGILTDHCPSCGTWVDQATSAQNEQLRAIKVWRRKVATRARRVVRAGGSVPAELALIGSNQTVPAVLDQTSKVLGLLAENTAALATMGPDIAPLDGC